MGSIKESIYCSINSTAMKYVVVGDVMAAVGNLQLKVDPQESILAKCKNRVTLAT
jgi:hypothetical protein